MSQLVHSIESTMQACSHLFKTALVRHTLILHLFSSSQLSSFTTSRLDQTGCPLYGADRPRTIFQSRSNCLAPFLPPHSFGAFADPRLFHRASLGSALALIIDQVPTTEQLFSSSLLDSRCFSARAKSSFPLTVNISGSIVACALRKCPGVFQTLQEETNLVHPLHCDGPQTLVLGHHVPSSQVSERSSFWHRHSLRVWTILRKSYSASEHVLCEVKSCFSWLHGQDLH